MAQTAAGVAPDTRPGINALGLVIILKPSAPARPVIERAVNRSVREHEPKDFIDLLENVGVLLWLGPAEPEHMGDSWREFIYAGYAGRALEREIWPGSDGRMFVLVFARDRKNTVEIEPWKALVRRMVRKFF